MKAAARQTARPTLEPIGIIRSNIETRGEAIDRTPVVGIEPVLGPSR